MNKILRSTILATLVLMGTALLPTSATRVFAQATINTTTLSAAVTATAISFRLASVSTVAVGQVIYVDREAMRVNTVNSTTAVVTVTRGFSSTNAVAHASGAVAYTGPANYFSATDVSGPCTATNEVALPHINMPDGNVFQCSNSLWTEWAHNGYARFAPTVRLSAQTYTVLGAITIQPGVQYIGSSGALAMTLANPSTAQNGMVMILIASTAQAHTVTYTAGFGGGTTARDVATFGGAINDEMVIYADSGVWWVISTRNVTLG